MGDLKLRGKIAAVSGGGRGLGRALVKATRCLALALAPEIRVNAVAPGILDPPGAAEAVERRIPQGRFGAHAEAVQAVLFLVSGATYTTGEVVRVDGGRALA